MGLNVFADFVLIQINLHFSFFFTFLAGQSGLDPSSVSIRPSRLKVQSLVCDSGLVLIVDKSPEIKEPFKIKTP